MPTTSYEQPLSYDVPMTNNDSDFDSQSVYSTHSYASYCPQFMTSSLPAKERIQEQAPLPAPMEPLPSSSFQQDMNQIHQQKATIDQQYQELMKKQEVYLILSIHFIEADNTIASTSTSTIIVSTTRVWYDHLDLSNK